MRNLYEVILQVLTEVPEEQKDVRGRLLEAARECRYRAPEVQEWDPVALLLQELFGPHEEEDWVKVALRIWRDEPPVMWVYNMDDVEWWAGPSLRACKADYLANYDAGDLEDAEEGVKDARAVTEEEMDRLVYVDEDEEGKPTRRSFREELARNVAEGIEFPCPFATTEY